MNDTGYSLNFEHEGHQYVAGVDISPHPLDSACVCIYEPTANGPKWVHVMHESERQRKMRYWDMLRKNAHNN